MATRGGYRPGAGRPKGSYKIKLFDNMKDGGPKEYLLSVMRDPKADPNRRDRAAIAALPYCHPKIMDQRISGKQLAQQAADRALSNDEWADDLIVAN